MPATVIDVQYAQSSSHPRSTHLGVAWSRAIELLLPSAYPCHIFNAHHDFGQADVNRS